MAEQDGQTGQWLPLAEAALLLGQTVDSLRKQIRRGRREGQRDNRGQWLVRVQPGQDEAGRTPRRAGQPSAAAALTELDGVRAELDKVRTELAAALARLDERNQRLADLQAEVAFLRAELARRRWPGLKAWWRRVWEGEAASSG